MKITIPEKIVDIREETNVLVVGGGPAGIGAAVAAARQGGRVILLEKRGFLGGNITGSYVETCNYFFRNTPFEVCGIFADMENKYGQQYGNSHDIRENAPNRFSSEYLKIFLDEYMQAEGVNVKFYSFVNEVVIQNDRIECVIIQSKQGPYAIKADVIIDCTGDGDVAFSAGIPFEQGREKDGLCQPGTTSFRVVGVDVDRYKGPGIPGKGDPLRLLGLKFKQDYRAGITGLKCKRQDLPFGRLTPAGLISYVNYPCAYGIDPTSIDGLTQGEIECRQYIKEMYYYMKKNFEGFENVEVASIAPEIGFRDSRRIKGLYKLTMEDIEANKQFDDVIAVYPRFYDMLAPDAQMDGDGSVEGKGYEGHIYTPVKDRSYQIPFRTLLPVKIQNLMVAGRCISADHVAEATTRAISACMLTGQAAGAAASLANRDGVAPKDVRIPELQAVLKSQGVILP
jgi:hypothetical protein